MKTSTKLVLAAVCAACTWPAAAQLANPPSRQAAASGNDSAVVPDGITFYHGQTFLLRNGRAALVDGTLVPEGQVLTRAGRLVSMPPELTGRPEPRNQITPPATSDSVQDGVVHTRGKSYLVRGNTLHPIDNKLIPEGSVLNASNTLSPLPSDFSGFNVERTPAGTSTLPTRTGDGTQALSGQAGVPQQDRSAPQAPRMTPQPDVAAPGGATGTTRTGVAGGGSPNGNGALPVATYNGSTAAGVAAGISTFSSQGGGRTFQPGVNASGIQNINNGGTIQGGLPSQQGGTTGGVQQGTMTRPNGTTSAAVPGNTSTVRPGTAGTVNMQGTVGTQSGAATSQAGPTATQTGALSTQSNPPATQTGTVGNQATPTAAGGNTNNPNATPGSGSNANGGANGVSPGTAGGTGTGTSGSGASGGTSGGTSGGGTSGGSASSSGSSGGGTSGGSSGGGTSGGAGGGSGGGGT